MLKQDGDLTLSRKPHSKGDKIIENLTPREIIPQETGYLASIVSLLTQLVRSSRWHNSAPGQNAWGNKSYKLVANPLHIQRVPLGAMQKKMHI